MRKKEDISLFQEEDESKKFFCNFSNEIYGSMCCLLFSCSRLNNIPKKKISEPLLSLFMLLLLREFTTRLFDQPKLDQRRLSRPML